MYKVTKTDLRPGITCTLNQLNYDIPLNISIINLLQIMLQESSNTATDILLKLIGGPFKVTEWLRTIDIKMMSIDRYILEIIANWDGIDTTLNKQNYTLARYQELEKQVSNENLILAREKFRAIKKDNTPPSDMTNLLLKLFNNKLFNLAHTNLLLNIMRGCKRGQLRLLGMLPNKTIIAHKTGTLPGFAADVGIITLPYDAGNIAISVYIKDSSKELSVLERIIAEVGRTIYDYFLFTK